MDKSNKHGVTRYTGDFKIPSSKAKEIQEAVNKSIKENTVEDKEMKELRDACTKMKMLLDNPEPQVFLWYQALATQYRRMKQLLEPNSI